MTRREASKGSYRADDVPTEGQVKVGSLQRIADACEKMCLDRERLEKQVAFWKDANKRNVQDWAKGVRRISALRGVITKLKKAAKAKGATP